MSQLLLLLNLIIIILNFWYTGAFKQDPECGKYDEIPIIKINLGSSASPGDIPWIVNLRLTTSPDNRPFCSGTIIDRQWILTAAHCFASQGMADMLLADIPNTLSSSSVYQKLQVHVGDLNIFQQDDGETLHTVKQILIHSEYGIMGLKTKLGKTIKSLVTNDIALIKIEPMIQYSTKARPLCLPDNDVYGKDDVFVKSQSCQISGWGENFEKASMMHLQYGFIPILSPTTCETSYNNQFNRTEMLCAGSTSAGIDTCNGDSGGPLTCLGRDQRYFLYGIVSWGLKCNIDKKHSVGVYTRVGLYKNWVASCIDSLESQKFGDVCITLLQTYEKLQGKLIYGHPKPITEPATTDVEKFDVPPNNAIRKCSCNWRPITINLNDYQTTLPIAGKFIQKCISYINKPKNLADAAKECKTLDSKLLTIKSLQELNDFTTLEGNRLPVWLALSYKADQRKLRWDDGTDVSSGILTIVPTILDGCYKLIKNINNGFVIIVEPCANALNFICESIEPRFTPQINILTIQFNNLRRIKYCGFHPNQTYPESGQFNSILVDSPNPNIFYGINPKFGQKKYQILQFDYNGESSPALDVFYDRPQNNPADIPDAPLTEFGGMDITPDGKYLILSDTVQKGRKVSTIHKVGVNGDAITSILLESSAYYVIDVAVHSSGELYLCNNRGRISVFKSDPNLSFKRDFGQLVQNGIKLDMIDYKESNQYNCDSSKSYFTFADTTYVNIVGDWVYIVDQGGNSKSRLHAYPVLSRCPTSNQIPTINSQILRSDVDQFPLASSVHKIPNDVFIGDSNLGLNIIAFVYSNNVQIYYHIKSLTRNEIQFVNRFESQNFLFSYHSIAFLKNHLLAAYDSSFQNEKIVLFDTV